MENTLFNGIHPIPNVIRPKVTKKEVANHFNVTVRTIENWMERKWLPYTKLGRTVRFDLEEVDAAVAKKFGHNRD